MKSLYRKYRPTKLADVIGQDQVVGPLDSALKNGRVSHAYLFVGPRGCGKTSVARILAHEVNGFKYELEDDYVDIIEIDGASNRGIDNIRELREKVAIAPTSGKYKVYIIDEVHMLTKEAFNALLKTLEEPPQHVIFIMATTDAYKVPVTITSRAQTFTFKLADEAVMFKHLKKICDAEGIKIADDALQIIVWRGGGSFRDSLSLLDQISTLSDGEITKDLVVSVMGLPGEEKMQTLLEDYKSGAFDVTTSALKELLQSGVKVETLVEEMIARIVAQPEAQLLPLLAKLPEVKAPYAEAKLLVALYPDKVTPSVEKRAMEASTSRLGSRPSGPSPRADGANSRAAALRNPPSRDVDTPPSTPNLPSVNFNWAEFVGKVKSADSGVGTQVENCKYIATKDTLNIYPNKSFTQISLSKDAHKKILIDAADGLKVVIHDYNEYKNINKDDVISKMSDIMGGEVKNDGGDDPF